MANYKIIYSNFINPISDKKCNLLTDYAIISKEGKQGYQIVLMCPKSQVASKFKVSKNDHIVEVDLSTKVITPGFYDNHFHWVQDEVRMMPKENLLQWLENHTWPYEANFKSKAFATKKAKSFTKELAQTGTIGGACYGSIHAHSVEQAFEQFEGDFIIGNVLMTLNSPDYLLQNPKDAIAIVKDLAKKYKNRYVMTPRFAITTDPKTMAEGAKIANKHKSFIQTHLSETENEIDFVLSIYRSIKGFEDVKTYTEIYDRCNILGPKTIMGHGIYLSNQELKRLAETGTSIAHCPTSNAPHKELGLGSGLFDYKKANKFKVNWSLASDIGGGPFLSMLDVMNSFVDQNLKRGHKDASYSQALYRSTQRGAEILKIGDSSGNFGEGKFLNFVVIGDMPKKTVLTAEELLKKLIKRTQKNRFQFDSQIQMTSYRGNILN
ncbi:amidohydrolase family protein [Bacteriovorax sp. Seq25_V]|uniref:amidohydrolase family protein n=1 Tax=Bacteriovorax sp. Seq25_V TaxID=1201288 RepID=UPI00038A2FB1|nr:amidohydrolase family protein [Bacteriovorax sp. Seq25_V]EQC44883.1 putative guanine deaminase [Bacteriovorax sp. Seq25_V]